MKKVIPLDQVEVGMETSTAVLNKFGQILLGANIKIESHHLNILKSWGVITLEVHLQDETDDSTLLKNEQLAHIKEELLSITGWLPKNLLEEDLFEMAAQHKLEKQSSM